MNYIINAYALQDIGKRLNQEDTFFPPFIDPCHFDENSREWSYYDGTPHTDERLFLVCDGMGGHDRGEVASRIVVETMSKSLLQQASIEGTFNDDMVRKAVEESLQALTAEDDPTVVRKMGTTMTMLKFHTSGATVAHIGDSRVYQFRPAQGSQPARIMFRTEDHSCGNHILTRSMMASMTKIPEVAIDHITDIKPGDVFMLCSDGIFENMGDDALCSLLTDPNYRDVERVQQILQRCSENHDNHTAFVVRVKDVMNIQGKTGPDATLPPGTVLKSKNYTYHVEKVLGQGAFGVTYLVNTNVSMQGQLGTIHTGVKVAMKEFFMHNDMKREGGELIELSPDSKIKMYADKFRREASKLAMLSHPNIVRVLEVFEANNTIYYSMEYISGGSLNEYINRQGGLPEQTAIQYIRQIGSALSYLHANKMLHLDIKPANIMRSDIDNTLKIIDFGLAKRYVSNGDPESSANLGFGTTGYAPLEQADGQKEHEFSPQMDVYALGATYYKMLTAQTPKTAIDVLNQGLNTLPLVKKKVSQQSIDAIKAAMEPTVAKRIKTVKEFLDMLPRVDDQTIFPTKVESPKWPWFLGMISAIVVLGCAYMITHPAQPTVVVTSQQEEAQLNDDTFTMPMVTVEGGTFSMGCDDHNVDLDEGPVHTVTVSSFRMCQYEITQAQWRAVMENAHARKSKNSNYPVHNVSWQEVQTFIKRLNKDTGRKFRLPTEAEWEYAARGGKLSKGYKFSGSDDLNSVAWSQENSEGRLHPVGSLQPNELGIYDMCGNAWEYCSDWYGDYEDKDLTNPKGNPKGDYHVIRGGGWNSTSHTCRITYRQDNSQQEIVSDTGFRLVESIE